MKKLILFLFITCGCSEYDFDPLFDYYSYFDFKESTQGWEIDVVNYTIDEKDSLVYSLDHKNLPEYNAQKVLQVSVDKVPADAYIFIRNKLMGLQPGKNYHVYFEIKYNYSWSSDEFSHINLFRNQHKIGVSKIKPASLILNESNSEIRLNIETNMSGTYSNYLKTDSLQNNNFEMRDLSNQDDPLTIETNENGECWFFAGSVISMPEKFKINYAKIIVYWKELDE